MTSGERKEERRAWIAEHVTEWDEFGQGYGKNGLAVCLCGERRADGDWNDHRCPYTEQPEDWDGAPEVEAR